MKQKYEVVPARWDPSTSLLLKDGKQIAVFDNDKPNNHTNAQKVCDLLNETSRSQEKTHDIRL